MEKKNVDLFQAARLMESRGELASQLQNQANVSSGPVYATGILKAAEVRRMCADFLAQENIAPMTTRILAENGYQSHSERGGEQRHAEHRNHGNPEEL